MSGALARFPKRRGGFAPLLEKSCRSANDPLADIEALLHSLVVQDAVTTAMRASLWMLLVGATLLAAFWLVLVVASGFGIWLHDSNEAGLALQGALFLFPVGLWLGLRRSAGDARRSSALFIISWSACFAGLALFDLL